MKVFSLREFIHFIQNRYKKREKKTSNKRPKKNKSANQRNQDNLGYGKDDNFVVEQKLDQLNEFKSRAFDKRLNICDLQ